MSAAIGVALASAPFFVLALALGISRNGLFKIAMIAALIAAAVSCILFVSAERRMKLEQAHGYSTVPGLVTDVETRDPRSGRVIRQVGDPLLSWGEFRALIGKRTP